MHKFGRPWVSLCCCLLQLSFPHSVVVRTANITVVGNVTISNYSPEIWCDPVAPTPGKEKTLNLFRRENYSVPVIFWHLQKAGGSTICQLLIDSFARTLKRPELRKMYHSHTNCNIPEMIAEVVESPTAFSVKYRPQGKFFAAMEPSHAARTKKDDPVIDPNVFPFKYHDQPHIRHLLGAGDLDKKTSSNSSASNETLAWTNAVHVIGLRHPLDMAMSAFQYVFQPDRFSMLDRCHAWNMTINECVTAAMDLIEQPPEESPLNTIYKHYTDERTKNISATNSAPYYRNLNRILKHASTIPLSAVYNSSLSPTNTTRRRRLLERPLHDMATVEVTLGSIRNYRSQMEALKQSFYSTSNESVPVRQNKPQIPIRRLQQKEQQPRQQYLPKWWKRLLTKPLFDVWQQHRIRYQVFGNYSIQHLSLNNNLETAKQVPTTQVLVVM